MNSLNSMLAAVRANPFDRNARMAYADALDDADKSLEAARQRVVADPDSDAHRLAYAAHMREVGDSQDDFIEDSADFIEDSVAGKLSRSGSAVDLVMDAMLRGITKQCGLSDVAPGMPRLWPMKVEFYRATSSNRLQWVQADLFKRGFAENWTFGGDEWITYGDRICHLNPVRKVTIGSWPLTRYQGERIDPKRSYYQHRILDRTPWWPQWSISHATRLVPHRLRSRYPYSNWLGLFALTWPGIEFDFSDADDGGEGTADER